LNGDGDDFVDFAPTQPSRRQLTAVSSISHPPNPAVGNSPPFLTNLPFHDFPKYFNHD
jgi:hypothetical protein